MKVTAEQVMEAVITALDQPRNRMGKLDPRDAASGEPLRKLACEILRDGQAGAVDRIDQAVKVLRAFLSKEAEEAAS